MTIKGVCEAYDILPSILNSFLLSIINLSINDFIKQLLPEPVSPMIKQDSPFFILNLFILIKILLSFVPIFASWISMEYLSDNLLFISELFEFFFCKNFSIRFIETKALIISLIRAGKFTRGPRILSNISRPVIKSAISKNFLLNKT